MMNLATRATLPLILALATLMAACGDVATDPAINASRTVRQTTELLDQITADELRRSPELASRLGLSVGLAGYDYKGLVDDRSQAAFERARLQRIEALERFEALPGAIRDPELERTRAVVHDAYERMVAVAAFGYGHVSLGDVRPYAADHLAGAYIYLQNLLLLRHPVMDADAAGAYLGRLSALAGAIDDDTRRLTADAAAGVAPPDFILAVMARHAAALRAGLLEPEPPLVAVFSAQLAEIDTLSDAERAALIRDASELVAEQIAPAYARFETRVNELEVRAPGEPGVWQVDQGDAYYDAAIRFYAGPEASAEQIHADGLRIVDQLTAILDVKLVALGFADGTVGERLALLSEQDDQIFADNEDGRAALLAYLEERQTSILPQIETILPDIDRDGVAISPVDPLFEDTSLGGFYAPALAGTDAPAIFHINLKNIRDWPKFALPTLVYHETVPGHHLQTAVNAQPGSLPLIRQMIWSTVYGEGWALYAEDLANEIGVYADDPMGEVGYLQSLLFRAARLVADTGIHRKRWSRTEAIDYMASTTGLSRSSMEAEVNRYVVWPGQAVTYMIGRMTLLRLRRKAEQALGTRFDRAGFHDIILADGPRPMSIVEADVDAWIAERTVN